MHTRNNIGYTSEDEADLAAEIPSVYCHGALDAANIAEAVIESDWLAAHDKALSDRIAQIWEYIDGSSPFGEYVDPAPILKLIKEGAA